MLGLSCPIYELENPTGWSLRTSLLGLGPDMAHLRLPHSNSSEDTLLESVGAEMVQLGLKSPAWG